MVVPSNDQIEFYNKLHHDWKTITETSEISEIFDLTLSFISKELHYQRAVIFVHDDATGLFRIQAHLGYDDPKQQRMLKIITLLLSGDIVEFLRTQEDSITHTADAPHPLTTSLLRTLGFAEAYLTLFAGNANVPFGLIIVGNTEASELSSVISPCTLIALRNLIANLSYASNNALFFRSWHNERLFLQENIDKKTKALNEQKETFEGIYNASKDGIAILDIHTTAFLDANPAYLEMTGHSYTELLRTSCLALTHPDDRSRSAITLDDVKRYGFVKDFLKRCITKDGQELSVNMSLVLMHDQERVLVTTKDMTQRIQLEQELRYAKDRIEAAHNHTLSSIQYASLIQRSLLPEDQLWKQSFSDYFCIWQPKDVVGGDIYSLIPVNNGNKTILMLIDCTGHGVPGAFVTMLVKAIEQQVLNKYSHGDAHLSPASLLMSFHNQLVKMLKYDEQTVMKHIGFDGAIICYDKEEQCVRYAGAKTSLYYMNPKQETPKMESISGSKQSIGYKQMDDDSFTFTEHCIPVTQGMRFYLTTDGYHDQLGGEKMIPLGKRKFQQLLLDLKDQPLASQSAPLHQLFRAYMRNHVQTDDVSFVGFEI